MCLVLCALLMLFLSAGACLGVTVTGQDNTSLGLNQIGDIIRHVTGNTSKDLTFGKDSLYMLDVEEKTYPRDPPVIRYTLNGGIYSFSNDGSKNLSGSFSDTLYYRPFRNQPSHFLNTSSNYQRVSAVLTSTVRNTDNGKLLLDFVVGSNSNLENGANAYAAADDGSIRFDYSTQWRTVGQGVSGAFVDAKAGITVKGYDGELAAILMRDGENFSVHLAKINAGSTSGSSYAESVSCSWSGTTGSSGNVPKMLDGTIYFPLSMAVGDFNGDGYTNEIAVVDSNRIAVHYRVLQISHTGSTSQDASFSVSVLSNGDVGSYGYGGWYEQYTGRYQNMDGISCTFSACTVAGDFDGDGKTEFAVIYRDTSPSNSHFWNFADNNSLFVGYTGKIHVKTYKWNGSTFQTEEDVRGFDYDEIVYGSGGDKRKWNNIDLPLGVKAAVGDFDGDGHDDIAVLRIMLQYTEQYYGSPRFMYSNFVFGAFVDWYTFDYGSIKPKYNGHSNSGGKWNYGDNKNGWVGIRTTNIGMPMFREAGITDGDSSQANQNKIRQRYYLEPITGEQKPYPVIDREFDIIAGKFSGQVGKAMTRDDLIIKYPQWSPAAPINVSINMLRSHVALMTNIPGVTNWGTEVHEIAAMSERDHMIAFAKADFLGEGVSLGEPVKITDTTDQDYTAILQMFPYHIDNLTSDGTALTKDPQSFTLRLGTEVTYNNTTTSSDTKNLTYGMTKAAETIFAVDNPALRTVSKTFQGIRGIMTSGLFNNDVVKKISGIGGIWDKLKDTVETTTTKSNQSSKSYTMSITTQANYQDTLYVNQSTRYLWRYPVLQVPAPSWLIGQTKDTSGSFDESQAMTQQSYITFAMSEPAMPTSAVGINDSHYQPYHELGNLFSYPAALEQTEGYEGRQSLTHSTYDGPIRWDGAAFRQEITLSKTTTNQEDTKKVNKIGAVTKFLSAIDNLFGSSMAKIPQNSDSSFTRSVTDGESISINIPAAYSGARFTALFETYLDAAGTMTSAFAVERFNRDDALWGKNSLYSLKPDPSLILPEKFDYTPKKDSDFDRAVFAANENDPTAIKMRGVRFKIADYDLDSDNLLMKGLKYTITVPVYNASFKDAENFKVRLSYAKTNDYNAQKTTIGDYTFTKLPGWGNGDHRQRAVFTWTPEGMDDGIYYLFADIDPENVLDEVHENRRSSTGTLIDAGGNNMGYWRVGITTSDSLVFDRSELENAGFRAAEIENEYFPFMDWIKADGLELEEFLVKKVAGAGRPVPVELVFDYPEGLTMSRSRIIGRKLKPEARGKYITEVTDEDIDLVLLNARLIFFPNEAHKLHFRINPAYLSDGVFFVIKAAGKEYPLTDIIYSSSLGSSGGGCESFSGSIAGVLALVFLIRKRTR